jgi:class 3 adenylate cyclase
MKNVRKYLLIWFCGFSAILLANSEIEQLEAQLPIISAPEKLEVLNTLIQHYQILLPEKSIAYGKQALELLSQQINIEKLKAHVLNKIGIAYMNLGDYDMALKYFENAAKQWENAELTTLADKKDKASAMLNMGTAFWRIGEYDPSLKNCLKALQIYEEINDQKGIADSYHNIGIVNDLLGNYEVALEYHFQALDIRTTIGDKAGIADSYNNIGIIYVYFTQDFDNALEYYLKSLKIREELNDQKGIAKNLNNVGFVYKSLNNYNKALEYYLKSIQFWTQIGDKYELANVSNNIGQLHIAMQHYKQAQSFLEKGLKIAQEIDAKELIRENYEFLSDLYLATHDYQKALEYYKLSSEVRQSIYTEKSRKIIADMQTKYETDKKEKAIQLLQKDNDIKQLELDREQIVRNSLLGGFLFVFILAFVMYNLYRLKKKANAELEKANEIITLEKEKSDELLLNILPARVAHDLKETGKTLPESFENVTVYFSDIVGFTTASSTLEPNFLIEELNDIFTAFDNIIEKNDCERIKTIGDAYLCVCGMPEENKYHAKNVVQSATEIIAYLNQRNEKTEVQWRIRIGIHTGKVVGGVVGIKKYIYDVFGDSINTASRMESNSEPMRINISETTKELVKDKFQLIERGPISVKGKGEMKMYFVDA